MWNRDINSFQRSFPRTMRDAFKGVDYACAIERPKEYSAMERVFVAVILVVAAAVIGSVLAIAFAN